jgi:RHS repeat-associated protein
MRLRSRWLSLWLFLSLLAPTVLLGNAADSDDLVEGSEAMRALLSTAREPWEDYDKFLQSRQALTSHGPELFGDNVNLYNGALSFSVTDIDLPGNSGIPVSLTRTFSVGAYPIGKPMDGAFGDWDIDLPRIEGVYGPTWTANRCSQPNPGFVVVPGGAGYPSREYWQGLQAQMPGGGELLVADTGSPRPNTGDDWLYVTPAFTYVRCVPLPAGSNATGEGFEAITADGTRYTFSHMAQTFETPLARPINVNSTLTGSLVRKRNVMYVTRIRDRFDHSVEFEYDSQQGPTSPVRLKSITASDGRHISVTYTDGRITSASAHGRSWIYGYDTQAAQAGSLNSVSLPDDSRWLLRLRPLSIAEIQYSSGDGQRDCASIGAPVGSGTPRGEVTHPSGAVGAFTVAEGRHGRSNVARVCLNWDPGVNTPNNPDNDVALIPHATWLWRLSEKTVTGPALPELRWNYAFGATVSWACSADNEPNPRGPRFTTSRCPATIDPVCTSDGCAGRSIATVSGPAGEWVRYTFGNSYRYDEGLLRKVERGTGPTNILHTETTEYQLAQSGQPYALPRGRSLRERADGFISEQPRPRVGATTTRDGTSFVWAGAQFDVFARPLSVTRSSSLGYSRTESLTYFDQTALWVLGQLERTQVGSTIPAQTTFDPATALPTHVYAFGVLQARYVYHTAAAHRGLLAEIYDAANVNKASVGNYKRGLPQAISRPLGFSMTADVNDRGEIESITDPLGSVTGYLYDDGGRVRAKEYRYTDSTAWSDEATNYTGRSSGNEYGLPNGLWKRSHTRGRYEHVTWYDALWRPILTRERDVTLPGSERFIRKAYDARGNLSFESYPGALPNPATSYATLSSGISRQYDALNRPTVETRSSELGNLVSSRAYLSGFQVRDTNARGKATTSRFMAFDEPTYDWPVRIEAPISQTTVIDRDVWGKPTAVTRTGLYQGWQHSSVTRRFVYDAHQRLCKRIDPEHGATVMNYDSSSRLLWTADGQALSSATACNRESVPISQRVVRAYNDRDELTGIDYPDSTDDINFTYHPDGALWTASVGPVGSRISHTYSYNKRRLPTEELLQVDGHSFPIGYRYSSEGALSELGYPDSSWEALDPDGLGRPRQMGQYANNITWHRFGPLAGLTYGNGLTFSQSLNARGLPSARSDSSAGVARLSETYAWDANGNLSTISDLIGNAGFYQNASRWMNYDDLDRLTLADSAAQPPLRSPWGYSWGLAYFSYDGQDNLRSFQMGAADFTYAYDSQGRLQNVSQAGEAAPLFNYTHNARGQMTGRQFRDQHFTLHWDSAHRLTSTQSWGASGTESYRYDAHGHRVRTVRGGETVHQAYTRGGDLLWERSSNGTTRKYARVGGRLIGEAVNGSRLAIHTDVIGSVRQKTNAFGSAVHEDIRAPYGSTLIGRSYQNGPAFTGHMEDGGTGLTYMKARYYDPVAMRFISPDPVYVDLSTGGNFNRYWYANNNPYSYTDPDGRVAKVLIPATIAGGLCLRNPIACQRTIERTAAMVRVGITGGRLLTEIQDTDSVTGGSDDERIPSSTGTRELGDLETIHAPGHPQNDPKIGELSDRDLEESIKNPTAGDKITVKGNRVLDGNTRINEAKSRGWPSDTTIPVEELPETPKNIDENPLGPYRDF